MKASVDQQLLLLRLEQLDTAEHAARAEMRRSALPPNANEMYKRYKSEGVAPLAEAQKALTRSLAVLGKAQLDLDNLANKLERYTSDLAIQKKENPYSEALRKKIAAGEERLPRAQRFVDHREDDAARDQALVDERQAIEEALWESIRPFDEQIAARRQFGENRAKRLHASFYQVKAQLPSELFEEFERLQYRYMTPAERAITHFPKSIGAVAPLIEGACGNCKQEFSVQAPEDELVYCPACGCMLVRAVPPKIATPDTVEPNPPDWTTEVWLPIGRCIAVIDDEVQGTSAQLLVNGDIHIIDEAAYNAWIGLQRFPSNSLYGPTTAEICAPDLPLPSDLAALHKLGLVVTYNHEDLTSVNQLVQSLRLVPMQAMSGAALDKRKFEFQTGDARTATVRGPVRDAIGGAAKASNIAELFDTRSVLAQRADRKLTKPALIEELLRALPELIKVRAVTLDYAQPSVFRTVSGGGSSSANLFAVGYPMGERPDLVSHVYTVSLGGEEISLGRGNLPWYEWQGIRRGSGATDLVGRLIELGVVAGPATDGELFEFARNFQLKPLQGVVATPGVDPHHTALSQSAEDRGTPVFLSQVEYSVWRASLAGQSLLRVAQALKMADSADKLREFLAHVQHIMSLDAGYLEMSSAGQP